MVAGLHYNSLTKMRERFKIISTLQAEKIMKERILELPFLQEGDLNGR